MADTAPKINVSPVLTMPLAVARKGYQQLAKALAKYPVAEKVSQLGEHPVVKSLDAQRELLLAAVGLALVLHGAQFKNLLLCFQVVVAFLYERVKSSLLAMWSDVSTAHAKLLADAPAEEPATKDSAEDKSKHAKKRDAKKVDDKVSAADSTKEDAEAAKKVLKSVDSEKLATAGMEVLVAAMTCILVIHGGLAQKVAIAYALVSLVAGKVDRILEFPGYEGMEAWTHLLVRFVLWLIVLPAALFLSPFALAANAALYGATLVVAHGLHFLKAKGKVEDAEAVAASAKGLAALLGLAAFGTLWQLWSWAAGSGMAWYFQILYLPALVAETLLGLL